MLRAFCFGLIVAVVVAGLDYAQAWRAQAGAAYGVTDHLRARVAAIGAPTPLTGLAALLPAAPEGMTRRPAEIEDSFVVMGRTPSEDDLAEARKNERELKKFLRGYETARAHYATDAGSAVIDIDFLPALALGGKGEQFIEALFDAFGPGGPARDLTARDGVVFRVIEAPELGPARMILARVGRQGYISMVSSLDDAATLALLDGIDLAGLTARFTVEQPAQAAPAAQAAEAPAAPAGPCMRKAGKLICPPAG